MRKIIASISILLCGMTTLWAQTSGGGNCVGFLSSIEETTADLTDQQKQSLKLKVDQIITRNKVATTALYNAFIITPQIDIISQESLTSGIRAVNSVLAEVTLIASNSVDLSVYSSVTVEVKATGNSQEQAITSVISSLRATDPRFTKFINSAVTQITSYYSSNMPTILRKTETLIAAQKYEDAITFLESIPTCVPSYEQSSEAIQTLYQLVSDKNCYVAITQAERLISFEEYEEAREILMSIEVGSECDTKVSQLLTEISKAMKGEQEPVVDEYQEPSAIEPQVVTPATVLAEKPEVTSASSNVITCDFQNFDVTFVSCKSSAADNTVTITLMVKNTSELANSFSLYSANEKTFLFNENGDTFYCTDISDRNFILQPNMPRKVTLTFSRIPTSNSVLSGLIGASDKVSSSIKITNMKIKW